VGGVRGGRVVVVDQIGAARVVVGLVGTVVGAVGLVGGVGGVVGGLGGGVAGDTVVVGFGVAGVGVVGVNVAGVDGKTVVTFKYGAATSRVK
jgi:hypothetical protein